MSMERRSLFKAALAGAVSSCLRFLPMPKAPEPTAEAQPSLVDRITADMWTDMVASGTCTVFIPDVPLVCCGCVVQTPLVLPIGSWRITCPTCGRVLVSGMSTPWVANDLYRDLPEEP